MRFTVTRTSDSFSETPPVPGAERDVCLYKDWRTADDPSKIRGYLGQDPEAWWYGEGTNHQVVNGMIVRDRQHEVWFVDVEDLEALVEFADTHGPLVVTGYSSVCHEHPSIEIYDDYRE